MSEYNTEYRLGFSRRPHLLAMLIRGATRSRASHCYIRQIVPDHSDLVLEAVGGHGVSTRPYEVFFARRGTRVLAEYRLVADQGALDSAWRSIQSDYLDRRYGWGQLVGDAWVLGVEAVTGDRPRNPLASRALVCSELCLRYLRRAGLEQDLAPASLRPDTVHPEDLWRQAATAASRSGPAQRVRRVDL